MEFNLKKPCGDCPFRADKPIQKGWLGRERAIEIATNVLQKDNTFTCHKTLHKPQDKQSMCAGALQMLHNATKQDSPWGNSTIQIAERLGLYDPNQQDFESVPVSQTIEQMADFHSFEESSE